MSEAWKQYAADFNAMSDEEIERESNDCRNQVDEAESWLEAVAAWEAAGKPREPMTAPHDVEGLAAKLTEAALKLVPEMSDGEMVPRIADTARDAGVSVADARKALRELRAAGLAEYGPLTDLDDGSPRGSGTWLTGRGLALRQSLRSHLIGTGNG